MIRCGITSTYEFGLKLLKSNMPTELTFERSVSKKQIDSMYDSQVMDTFL